MNDLLLLLVGMYCTLGRYNSCPHVIILVRAPLQRVHNSQNWSWKNKPASKASKQDSKTPLLVRQHLGAGV